MLLEVNLDGTIVSISDNQLFENQELTRFDDLSIDNRSELTVDDFISGDIQFRYPYFSIDQGRLNFVVLPSSPPLEVYMATSHSGNIFYSDDFFELCKLLGEVTKDVPSINHFIDHWTFPINKTYFMEISRLTPSVLYQHNAEGVITHQCGLRSSTDVLVSSDTDMYNSFKKGIDETIKMQASSDKNALFLSGGVDSVLIGLVFNKLSIPFKAYTSVVDPEFNSSVDDDFDSRMISNVLGWEHETVRSKLDDIPIDYIDKVLFSMPMSSHMSLDFIALVSKMKQDGIRSGFSGQNMDSLYNLGPTSRLSFSMSNMADLLRRTFLTDQYFRSLNDVKGGNQIENYMWRGVGHIGSAIYSAFKKIKYIPPVCASELIYNYCHSNDYIVFTNSKSGNAVSPDSSNRMLNCNEVRADLLNYKVNNYLMTGAPQAIYQAGRVEDFDVFLPYSSEKMVKVFRGLSMGYKDIAYPKRFVYRYIHELAGMPYKKLLTGRKVSKQISYHKWSTKMLESTLFGRSLKSSVGELAKPEGYTDAQLLQHYFAKYWEKKIFEKLSELNVNILEGQT